MSDVSTSRRPEGAPGTPSPSSPGTSGDLRISMPAMQGKPFFCGA